MSLYSGSRRPGDLIERHGLVIRVPHGVAEFDIKLLFELAEPTPHRWKGHIVIKEYVIECSAACFIFDPVAGHYWVLNECDLTPCSALEALAFAGVADAKA